MLDYNRVAKDLNGHTKENFLEALTKNFEVTPKGAVAEYRPAGIHEFSL